MHSDSDDSTSSKEKVYIKHVKPEKKSKRKLVEKNKEKKPGLLNVRNTTLDNFLEARKHIKSILDKSTAQHIKINSDEEVWIFQCPKNIEVNDLMGRKLVLSQPVQVIQSKRGNTEFECKLESTKHSNHLTLICPTNGFPEAISVKQAGMITIRERIQLSQPRNYVNGDINSNSVDLFKYPTNLKIRHPLLGVNFDNIEIKEEEDDISISSASPKKKRKQGHDSHNRIEIKQEPDEESLSKKDKKRKKRLREVSDDDIVIKQEPSGEALSQSSRKEKRHSKKRRLSDGYDVVKIKIEDATPIKHKRTTIKSEPMSPEE